jgi:ABC-type transport system involved in multi-copper enzyme maturation permease subunit
MRPILAIARLTLAEARAARLHWALLVLVLLAAALGRFTARLALVEGEQTLVAMTAAVMRIGVVAMLGLFAIHTVTRERQDGRWRFTFARPLARRDYVFGKLAALATLALLGALAAGVLLWGRPVAWPVLLFAEALLVAAFGLACALSLSHAVPAILATAAFYLLSRSSGALLDLAQGSAASLFGLLVPRLDLFARSEWLLYAQAGAPPAWLAVQAAVYTILLAALAVADLERRTL